MSLASIGERELKLGSVRGESYVTHLKFGSFDMEDV